MITSRIKSLFENRDHLSRNSQLSGFFDWGMRTNSGESMSATKSLENSSVWRAVSLISGDMSSLPLLLYRRTSDGKDRATDHPGYRLMRWKTGTITANIWKARTVAQMLLYGNSFSRIIRSRSKGTSLVLLHPDNVQIKEAASGSGSIVYLVGRDKERVPQSEMLHIQGLTLDSLGGLSLIHFARNTFGRHLAAESFTDDFFANGAVTSGWFQTESTISEEAQANFLKSYQEAMGKKGNRHKAFMLEDGMKFTPSGVNPRDAMMVEMLQLTPYDVARYFGLPPQKLGIQWMQPTSNSEAENGDYFSSTLVNICTSIEYESWDKLLTEEEKTDLPGGLYYEFLLNSLLRARATDRYTVYQKAIANRILNPNECRAFENLNPYEGGDLYVNPFTTANSDVTGQGKNGSDTEGMAEGNLIPEKEENSLRDQVALVVRDSIKRCAKRLTIAAESAAKNPKNYKNAIDTIRNSHENTIKDWLSSSIALAANVSNEDEPQELLQHSVDTLFDSFVSTYSEFDTTNADRFLRSAETMACDIMGAL